MGIVGGVGGIFPKRDTIPKHVSGRRKRPKVFVSYSRHDEAFVKPLAGLLNLAGDDAVFLDINALRPGDLWEQEIMKAIQVSKIFVLCWCCESEKSEFVGKEIETALTDGSKRFVPVLFCEAKLPARISTRQWIDLRGRIVHQCAVTHETVSDSVIPKDEMSRADDREWDETMWIGSSSPRQPKRRTLTKYDLNALWMGYFLALFAGMILLGLYVSANSPLRRAIITLIVIGIVVKVIISMKGKWGKVRGLITGRYGTRKKESLEEDNAVDILDTIRLEHKIRWYFEGARSRR